MILLTWLTVLLAVTLCGVTVLCVVLNHRNQTKWMRIFSEKQGIPIDIMENRPHVKQEVVKLPDTRKKISVPIPGAQMFRKAQ